MRSRLKQEMTVPLLVGFVTFIGVLLRFYHAGTKQFWGDEIHTFEIANVHNSFGSFIHGWWNGVTLMQDPPTFYIISYINKTLLGNPSSHLLIRLPVILMGAICLPLIYRFIRNLFNNKYFAILVTAMCAVSSFAIEYSQEYRPYSMLLLTSLLWFDSVQKICEHLTIRRWLWLFCASTLLIYTHIFGCLVLVSFYPFWLIVLWQSKDDVSVKNKILAALGLPVSLLLIYMPVLYWLWTSMELLPTGKDPAVKAMYDGTEAIPPVFFRSFSTWRMGSDGLYPWVLNCLYATIGLGIATAFTINWRKSAMIFGWLMLYFCLCFAFYECCKFPYDARRNITILPIFWSYAALGLLSPVFFAQKFSHGKKWALHVGMAVSICFFSAYAVLATRSWIEYDSYGWKNESGQSDWKGIAEFLSQHAAKKDTIAFATHTWVGMHYRYYKQLYPTEASISVPKDSRHLDELRNRGPVWFIFQNDRPPQQLTEYLHNTNATWIPFFNAGLLYLPQHTNGKSPLQKQAFAIPPNCDGIYSVANDDGSPYIGAMRIEDSHGEEIVADYNKVPQAPTVTLKQGLYNIELLNKDKQTTLSLFCHISPNSTQSPLGFINFSYPENLVGFQFPLHKGKPILSLQYNSSVNYGFYIREGGKRRLSLNLKDDFPGPVNVRVFSNGIECPAISVKGGNNQEKTCETWVGLKDGFNVLNLYYNSFKRLTDAKGPASEQITTFNLYSWKIY